MKVVQWTVSNAPRGSSLRDVSATIIEPLLQIHRLLDFCWPHFCTFCPEFSPIILHLPLHGSHIFISSFCVHKLLLYPASDFGPTFAKMSHQCHTRQLCQFEAPTDVIDPVYWRVGRSSNLETALWPFVTLSRRCFQVAFSCSSPLRSSWNLVFSFIWYIMVYDIFCGIFNVAQPFDRAVILKL